MQKQFKQLNSIVIVIFASENSFQDKQGGQLTAMTIVEGTTVTATMYFYYNASGVPVALKYNNVVYYYITNLQGDVVGIVGANGLCATYTYDAWGNIIKMDVATNAPYYALMANPQKIGFYGGWDDYYHIGSWGG